MVELTATTGDSSTAADPKANGSRVVSTIQFPYSDLNEAIQVARKLHDEGGGRADLTQLAAWLGHATLESGAVRIKLSAARMFGLIVMDRKQAELSELGREIVDPDREKLARAKAFLKVPLYRAIFDRYDGNLLPPPVGLERVMADMGVSSKQTDKARQTFQRSADQAGLFDKGANRLVLPGGITSKDIGAASTDDYKVERRKTPTTTATVHGHGEPPAPPSDNNGKTVRLRSGGTVTLSYTANLFGLSREDREFLFGLIDKVTEYEEGATGEEED